MPARAGSLSPRLRLPLAASGLFVAALEGALLAGHLKIGLALLFAFVYAPLILFNMPAALGVWAALNFVQILPQAGPATTVAGCALLLGWVGETAARRAEGGELTVRHRLMLGLAVSLVAWIAASLIWATNPHAGIGIASKWLIALGILIVYGGTIRTRRGLLWVLGGFVAGATLSVGIGLAQNGLHASGASAITSAASEESRLKGGAGDPNYLAAALVPAIALCVGMMPLTRSVPRRAALLIAMVVAAIGLVATQSRGGVIAALVAAVLGIVLARGHRAQILGGVAIIAACMAAWLAANPGALQRLTEADAQGSGRTELWRVAIKMGGDHPLIGVGVGNFTEHSRDYAKKVGALEFSDLLTERPTLVHDLFLQTFAENGLIGVLLVIAAFGAMIATTLRALALSVRRNLRGLEGVIRAVLVGQIGALVAQVFLSDGYDRRLWTLLALGPVLLYLARHEEPAHV